MIDNVLKAIYELQVEVEKDTFNLTRNDHDAILAQINSLKDFIKNIYDERRKNSGLNE